MTKINRKIGNIWCGFRTRNSQNSPNSPASNGEKCLSGILVVSQQIRYKT